MLSCTNVFVVEAHYPILDAVTLKSRLYKASLDQKSLRELVKLSIELANSFIIIITAVPLTRYRHTGLDPVSSKSLKPLDSGLRRNDGTASEQLLAILIARKGYARL
jgi:hypothetical protein